MFADKKYELDILVFLSWLLQTERKIQNLNQLYTT